MSGDGCGVGVVIFDTARLAARYFIILIKIGTLVYPTVVFYPCEGREPSVKESSFPNIDFRFLLRFSLKDGFPKRAHDNAANKLFGAPASPNPTGFPPATFILYLDDRSM
jgi:hypothetical protein